MPTKKIPFNCSQIAILEGKLLENYHFLLPKLKRGAIVILRSYEFAFRCKIACQISKVCKSLGLYFLVANDALIAKKAKADGLHINSSNFCLLRKWIKIEKRWRFTISFHKVAEGIKAAKLECDFVIYSPVFSTDTHKDAKQIGITKFRIHSSLISKSGKVCPLGGINKSNIRCIKKIKNCTFAAISFYKNFI